MFLGEFTHTIDLKGRVFLPFKHRRDLGDTVVITKMTDPCLVVYPVSEWEKVAEKVNALPTIQGANVKREIFSNASEEETDKQGRILIPPSLRQKASLDKNVYIIGVGNHIEIWAKELWDKRNDENDMEKLSELMINLGF